MASIYLLIQSKKSPAVIYIRLRDGRTLDIKAKTNYHIDPINWDETEQRPTKKALKDIHIANLDTDLATLKTDLLKEYNNSKGKKVVDADWLRNFINPPQEQEKHPDKLVDYIDTFIEFKKADVKSSTVTKCNVIKHLLMRYEKETKTTLYIRDIDAKFKMDFEKYCIKVGYAPNTTARNIRFIKTFCRHAKANGVETHYQLDSIKAKYHKVENIYLDEKEIAAIEKIESKKLTEGLENARDWLLISCYCGQRVSDFLRFDKSMIRYEKNKAGELKPLIEFTQVKTEKIMTIPLHKKIIEIMKKYDGNFPRKISDQKYNEHIKKVCEAAEINQPTHGTLFDHKLKTKVTKDYPKYLMVSSHIGRRSFASNNYGKIPTSFLMYITGHTTEAMFLTYIGKSNKDIAMELTNYF
ncbi:phage integrase SAM-like domain-containing protein [Flavobacterium sp.]|uniref:phage integrase SAM-like domain-containing protein n=1 Tax=Flavobacterium sp. TaxID=239 RepID=UPI0026341DF4|nr:phage integrase SAM-like domain-containing protein [Flavobacterium sp.]MDD2985525.1 phage integrase SAM-like domain-containing protein [Flavobacterium sp.]